MTVRGNVDRVSAEGLVFGWCLDDARPGARLDVTIRADGADIGTVQAAGERQDLRDAGIGDGRHGFIFTLPIAVLRQRRGSVITAFDAASGTGFGDSVVYRADASTGFDDRLTRIESDLVVIRDRIRVSPSSDAAIATLFEAVGGFFARLGQDLREGRPSAEGFGHPGQMDVLAAAYADIRFPIVATPRAAVFLRATVGVEALHAPLLQIAASRMVARADVFLLDPGLHPAVALLPGAAGNLRTLRLGIDPVASLDAIARAMHHETLVFLDGALPLGADWLDDLVEHMAVNRTAGIVGIAAASIPEAAGPLSEPQLGGAACSLIAVDGIAFAVRAEALAMCDGLDPRFADLDGALVDLCHRMRAAGWSVDAAPVPAGAAIGPGDPTDPARRRSLALLDQRWPMTMDQNPENPAAAFLVSETTDGSALVDAVVAAREVGYRPVVLSLVGRHGARALEPLLLGCHAQIVWSDTIGGVASVLGRAAEAVAVVCAPGPGERAAIDAALGASTPCIELAGLAAWLDEAAPA